MNQNQKSELSEVDLDSVAEWVGLHYGRNFDHEPEEKRKEWIERYIESHSDVSDDEAECASADRKESDIRLDFHFAGIRFP